MRHQHLGHFLIDFEIEQDQAAEDGAQVALERSLNHPGPVAADGGAAGIAVLAGDGDKRDAAAVDVKAGSDVRRGLQQAVEVAEVVVAGGRPLHHFEAVEGQRVTGIAAVERRRSLVAVFAVFTLEPGLLIDQV